MEKRKVKIRKKSDLVDKDQEEQKDEKQEDDSWQRHWEKEKDPNKPKKLGGGRRPRPFKINHSEE